MKQKSLNWKFYLGACIAVWLSVTAAAYKKRLSPVAEKYDSVHAKAKQISKASKPADHVLQREKKSLQYEKESLGRLHSECNELTKQITNKTTHSSAILVELSELIQQNEIKVKESRYPFKGKSLDIPREKNGLSTGAAAVNRHTSFQQRCEEHSLALRPIWRLKAETTFSSLMNFTEQLKNLPHPVTMLQFRLDRNDTTANNADGEEEQKPLTFTALFSL